MIALMGRVRGVVSGHRGCGGWRDFGGCEVGEAIDMGRYGDVPEALPDEKRWWESEC